MERELQGGHGRGSHGEHVLGGRGRGARGEHVLGGLGGHGHSSEEDEPLPNEDWTDEDSSDYSSSDKDSTDDDEEELAAIIDDDELMARLLAKSLRSEHREDKRHRADAQMVTVVNAGNLEQGLRLSAEHAARARRWEREECRQRRVLHELRPRNNGE